MAYSWMFDCSGDCSTVQLLTVGFNKVSCLHQTCYLTSIRQWYYKMKKKKRVIAKSTSLPLSGSRNSLLTWQSHHGLEGNLLSLTLYVVPMWTGQLISQQKELGTISEQTNLPWGGLAGKFSSGAWAILYISTSLCLEGPQTKVQCPHS